MCSDVVVILVRFVVHDLLEVPLGLVFVADDVKRVARGLGQLVPVPHTHTLIQPLIPQAPRNVLQSV